MGEIVAGVLAPHPPHLVYAENPPQNEPKAECGWENLRWAYERLRKDLEALDYDDTLMILSPHWQTYVGTHFLGCERFESLSVDPIFPNLFRYRYGMDINVKLAKALHDEAAASGLVTKMMTNPDFRVDYGTIVSSHMLRPEWDKKLVVMSSNRSCSYYSVEVMMEQSIALGAACRKAIEASGDRVVLVSSNSLSHRHFTTETAVPEDMSHEHIYNHAQYLWDMRIIDLIKQGRTKDLLDLFPEFVEQSVAEADAGSMTWLLSALGMPTYGAEVYGYGTVIGTGNTVAAWLPKGGSGMSEGWPVIGGLIGTGLPAFACT